ncbi:hypothetical protein AMAG_17369 [Allomyces macrogynus ATCC 38327]|uniref:chitin synthase n=1 Tax=Allomyces macrogynus (strain ATCC 38327) TaxID=578462 RepID=A0A0L0TE69_ALLM3|nr:hypothetical protein AMAG_17369 [Allomyces macrogynus ATCC 38327]|eukprot:KNE73173.1 hypothetical protein AMAG_17369 [Allomyces macrogynus ATCC 38327]
MAAPGGVPGRPLHRPSTTVGAAGATTGYTTALKDESSTVQLGARPAYDPSTTDLAGGSTARLAAASSPALSVQTNRFAIGNSSTAALSTVGNAGAGKTSKYPPGTKLRKSVKPDNVFLGKMTSERKLWLFIVTLLAGWVPEWVLKLCGIRGKDVIQAWREKFALVMMVVLASLLSIGWLEVSNSLLCPQLLGTMTWYQVATSRNLVVANGRVLDITKSQTILGKYLRPYVGKDVSSMIPAFTKLAHPAADSDAYADTDFAACVTSVRAADTWIMKRIVTDASGTLNLTADGRLVGCPKPGGRAGETETCFYSDATWRDVNRMVVGDILLDPDVIPKNFSDTAHPSYVVVLTKAYDVTSYLKQAVIYQTDNVATASYDAVQIVPNARAMFLQANFTTVLARGVGTDLSGKLTQTSAGATLKCLDKLFFAGRVTPPIYKSICAFGNPMLLAISGSIYSIVVIKFLVSLLFSFRFKPAQMNAYTLCFVPCYTEGHSMRVTLETLAACDYEDAKKLIVVVCDGNITGKGNPAPTPRIALEMLGWQGEEPEPKFYHALGKGADKINMGKAYSGWYTYKEHRVPYIVIAKVGKPDEAKKPKPGNRGKRDSQLILMNFFNKVLNQRPMSPFEYDLYYHIKHVVGVDPKVYEYCLMVDADTEVEPDSMNELVAAMVNDQRKIGVCGETMVSNKWASWVTAIQVHEYYINHHLGKAFESIFGSVTCLPGCFSMYRIRDHKGGAFLVSDEIIEDYKVNKVHTLHSKNLLHLGEDRYLTTLLLKHFPSRRLEFIPSAVCHTDIPDSFAVLLSQRRRWINSTFHNLYEVMKLPRLCSVCFVSMKTLVFMDLLSTLILPASTIYLYSLIVRMCIEGVDQYYLVLAGLAGLYGSHLFIILLVKKQYEYVLWIVVYIILAMPVFSIVLPLYAFWHFDDFSWGTTRQIEGADDGHHEGDASGAIKNIPTASLTEYEAMDPRLGGTGVSSSALKSVMSHPMAVPPGIDATYAISPSSASTSLPPPPSPMPPASPSPHAYMYPPPSPMGGARVSVVTLAAAVPDQSQYVRSAPAMTDLPPPVAALTPPVPAYPVARAPVPGAGGAPTFGGTVGLAFNQLFRDLEATAEEQPRELPPAPVMMPPAPVMMPPAPVVQQQAYPTQQVAAAPGSTVAMGGTVGAAFAEAFRALQD